MEVDVGMDWEEQSQDQDHVDDEMMDDMELEGKVQVEVDHRRSGMEDLVLVDLENDVVVENGRVLVVA